MRILILTNLYPNARQPGRAPFNRQQFKSLAARHPLRIIAPIAWTDEIAARWHGAAKLPRHTQCDGIPVDHPRYLFPPKILRSCYGRCFRRSVRRSFQHALSEFHPDIVLGSWAYPDGWAAVDLAHQAGLPAVVKVHGSDIYGLESHPSRQRGTIEALSRADGVIVVSRHLANRVITLGAHSDCVHVVYNGVDTQLFHPAAQSRQRLGLSPEKPIVLFIGNLVAVKGIDILIDACARLLAEQISFTCYLIGQGPLRSQLQRQIRDRGLSEHVKLLGAKPHNELPDWYRAADVFVLPSRSEGLPNVLLEAAACGTPWVASDVGGIPEIAHLAASRLVQPNDAASLARAVSEFLRDKPPQQAMTEFSDPVHEIEMVFDRVIDGAKPREQVRIA